MAEEKKINRLEVEEGYFGIRIDTYLAGRLDHHSRTTLKKMIQDGAILLNDKNCKPHDTLKSGDIISLTESGSYESQKTAPKLKAAKVDFEILYEDQDLIVINKPAGLVVHPGIATANSPTLIEGLQYHFANELSANHQPAALPPQPGIVHRLDKDTTGVMVCAKSQNIHEKLSLQFKEKTNFREYIALCDGLITVESLIHSSYLHRDPKHRLRFASMSCHEYEMLKESTSGGKLKGYRFAKTQFIRKKIYGDRLSLVAIRLFTGRTHQIRVHAKELNLPIVGDSLYHRKIQLPKNFPKDLENALNDVKRQLLHARVLGFVHPTTGKKMGFEGALPDDFIAIIKRLEAISESVKR